MEETQFSIKEHKVLVGFKCSPSLRAILCTQADKLGITLSSHVETIVSNDVSKQSEIIKLSEQVNELRVRIAFYENQFLKDLYEQYKGKTISYKNKTGETVSLTINSVKDIFTTIINSFKTTK